MTRPRALSRSFFWLLSLWLAGCFTEPAPARCYLLHYYADGSQVWECFNGAHEPLCHSATECRALSGAEETTP